MTLGCRTPNSAYQAVNCALRSETPRAIRPERVTPREEMPWRFGPRHAVDFSLRACRSDLTGKLHTASGELADWDFQAAAVAGSMDVRGGCIRTAVRRPRVPG